MVQKAAYQGIARAQHNLGIMYLDDLRTSKDYGEALRWFRKAADQGDEDARKEFQNLDNVAPR